jgi:putative lumazine-binding protein
MPPIATFFPTRFLGLVLATGLGATLALPPEETPPAEVTAPLRATDVANEASGLIGTWVVDLRPTPEAPAYLKKMIITAVEKGALRGRFYDTEMSEGRVNGDWGAPRFSFKTGDGSGVYHTHGVLRGDRIEGTTYSEGRKFLSVWTAHRDSKRGQTVLADHKAVKQAAEDYVRSIYEAKPELLDRSVHPALHKAGFYRPDDSGAYGPRRVMTFEELRALAQRWNDKGQRGQDLSYEVEVLDVLNKTASVRLRALWGYDYMLLSKRAERWQIDQIIWQSPAKAD